MRANILRSYRSKYKTIEYNNTYWMAYRSIFGYYIIDHYISTDKKAANSYYRKFILEKLAKKYYKFYI